MTHPAITYTTMPGAWGLLSRDIDSARIANDLYWTLRAFGLEGGLEIRYGNQEVRWGGFLLDVACGLSAWLDVDGPRVTTIRPVEQANDVVIDTRVEPAIVRSGQFELRVPRIALRSAVEGFLQDLAAEAARQEPRLARVAGFSWTASAP